MYKRQALDGAYQPAALNSKSVKFVAAEIEKIAPESEGTMYEFIEESPVSYTHLDVYKRQTENCVRKGKT